MSDSPMTDEVQIITFPTYTPRPLSQLLHEAGAATQDDVNSMGSSYAGMQAQFDQFRADVQRQIDEMRSGQGATPVAATATAARAAPQPSAQAQPHSRHR